MDNLTPVEKREGIWLKRDDLFTVAGVSGGKARACWALAQGAKGLVTAGSRHSPQVEIMAAIAHHLGIPAAAHIPSGNYSQALHRAEWGGLQLVHERPGYNSVIIARAKAHALEKGFTYIPFGMECMQAVDLTSTQVQNIPRDATKLVIPVGSGMTLAGVLKGMVALDIRIPVHGVVVGASPIKRLNQYAPGWEQQVTLVPATAPYEQRVEASIGGLHLDPIYEAKCLQNLTKGCLLWIVGHRKEG